MAEKSSDQVLQLLYRCDSEVPIPRNNILADSLMSEENYPSVLFVGEGNFTFTVAFVAYRIERGWHPHNVWHGVISTCYNRDVSLPNNDLAKVRKQCKDQVGDKPRIKKRIDKVPDIPPECLRYGIDATNLPKDLVDHDVIWFQCPWDPKNDHLIQDFLQDAGSKVQPNTLVCIGITTHKSYFKHYKLNQILGPYFEAKDGSTECLRMFEFVGADDNLIKDILSYGYLHMNAYGKCGLHGNLSKSHLTLIFKKKEVLPRIPEPIFYSTKNILYDILIKKKRPVLFVGEGNFTFTVAFAALRLKHPNPWDDIITSRYELVGTRGCHGYAGQEELPCLPAPVMAEVKQLCLNSVRRQKYESESTRLKIVRTIETLPDFKYHVGVDACNIPDGLIPPEYGVIWFQCPSTASVRSFLFRNHARIKANTYVCIGIANDRSFVDDGLKALLESVKEGEIVLNYYEYIGVDTELIEQIYKCGYFHSNPKCNGIPHVVLVFKTIRYIAALLNTIKSALSFS